MDDIQRETAREREIAERDGEGDRRIEGERECRRTSHVRLQRLEQLRTLIKLGAKHLQVLGLLLRLLLTVGWGRLAIGPRRRCVTVVVAAGRNRARGSGVGVRAGSRRGGYLLRRWG